jgi:hypothetical protein
MRRLFALLLILEGLSSALRFASRLPVLMFYPPLTIAFMAARFIVAVQQFSAGWMVMSGRPPGPTFARWALTESAVLVTFALGLGFAPTNLFPAYRWWAVGLYWAYALTGIFIFRASVSEPARTERGGGAPGGS